MSVVTNSGEELQLLKKGRGSLELDYDVLLSVLTHPSIGDRPISIVSIAGALRTGKSFMLNFFLRYLRNKGYENPNDWLGNPSSSFLKDGIEWRGGQQANTCGINIWSEPFIVKKGEKEIAVILLDTQGNSDHSDSRKNDVKVFVISVLLSSTFIYNIKSQIDSKDLESLQYFMEFAKARKDSESMKARFQFLWFLVRDWENDEDYSLGEKGGEEYLKTVLDTKDESSLKKYLRKAFETVNCYLMPNPGKKVRQAKNESSVTLADIKPECLQHISQFTECLLNPESLAVKIIEGDVVNGRWLAGYIAQVWKGLKDGGLPPKDTMMEAENNATFKAARKGKELQLLKKTGGSLELDYDVLSSVLTHPSIGDRPISIVSIAGAFRTGKSFMLNFFLRYLRNKGYENPIDWLGDPSFPLKDGIEWGSGSHANTCGINIWSEPFIVKKGEKEIAVILLDTQGNSDHSDSRENDVKVFVVSALLSSTFIYNIKSQINHHDLEYLQFFMEFAKAKKDSEKKKARIQFLWFLIRDWEYEIDHSLGEKGGEEYLKTVLDTKDESSLKKYLRQAFEAVNCYLMPNPGKRVRRAKNESSITVNDIEPECLEHILHFTECLLNPESLAVKIIKGDVVNGRWLAGYIADCWKELKKGGLPSSDTMMELMAKAKCQEFIEKCKEQCRDRINKMHQSYLPDERIQEIEQRAMSAAFKLYDENVKYGGEETIKKYRGKLENTIKQQFKTLHIANDAYKVETEAILQDAVTTCLDNYGNGVMERTHEKWTDKLELIHESSLNEAMKSFIVVSAKISCEQLVNSYNEELVRKLNQMYRRFESDNERYEGDAKNSFEILLSKAIAEHKHYLEEAIKIRSISDEEFITAHETGIEKAIIRFSTCCDIVCPVSVSQEYSMEKLLREIEENKQILWYKNESLKEAENNAVFKIARKGLTDLMEKEFNGKIAEEPTIKQKCKEFSKRVLKNLKPVESFFPKWEKEADRMIQNYLKENKERQNSTKRKLLEEENRIDKEFQEQCDKKLSADEKYIDEEELQRFIDSKIADLIETSLARETVATEKMKEMFRQAVEQLLEERAEEITSKNVDKKINYRLRLKQQLGQIKLRYIAIMEEKLNEAYIEPKVLNEFHEKLLKYALNEVRKDSSNLTVFMEHKNEVEKDLKSLHIVVHKWNEDNAPLRKKVIAVFELLTSLSIAGAARAFGIYSAKRLRKEAAAKVSSGKLGGNGGIMGSNDCVVEVPPKAIKEVEQIELSSSFKSEQWQEGYFAITPLFQCDPGDLKFLKEISIELPTWCSTSSKKFFAHLMENNVGGDCLKQNEIKLKSVSDYVIKFKTSHFNNFCCFVKLSEIDLCSFRLSLQLFLQDNHDVIVNFYLTDKTVQNVCETAMLKSGLIPNFEKIENLVVKHGESVDMTLRSLGNAVMDATYSMKFVVDNEFVRTGYHWKLFNLPNREITEDVKLEYILNGKTRKTEFKFINLENNDSSNAAKLALN